MTLPNIPAVTKVLSGCTLPPPFLTLPIGYPVSLRRDWNLASNPYITGVWVQYFTRPLLLGYLPDPVAIAVTQAQEAGGLVSARILQYMHPNAGMPPVITIYLSVKPQAAVI
jgi:hypothetical protein